MRVGQRSKRGHQRVRAVLLRLGGLRLLGLLVRDGFGQSQHEFLPLLLSDAGGARRRIVQLIPQRHRLGFELRQLFALRHLQLA